MKWVYGHFFYFNKSDIVFIIFLANKLSIYNWFDFNRYLITCGQDGDIRIWNGIEDSDPIEKCVGNEAFAIHQKVIENKSIVILYVLRFFLNY